MKRLQRPLFFCLILFASRLAAGDAVGLQTAIDFSDTLYSWDGFGFNYVQTSFTHDYAENPQEYGGFSILSESDKGKAVALVFGDEGLRVNLIKMFLDPLHQKKADGPYNHETSTESMREFVSKGLAIASQPVSVVSTLYCPPAFMTSQKILMGRDLAPEYEDDLIAYFVDWAAYLKKNGYPLKALSLHNEGEGWERWPKDGSVKRHMDYNMYWSPEQVAQFVVLLRDGLDEAGLTDVWVTPGETWSWDRFMEWGYAHALVRNKAAIEKLGLVTSHGFLRFGGFGRWKSENTPRGIDLIRAKRPDMHAWVTSMTWRDMGSYFVRDIYNAVYEAKINGLIPWAGIKRLSLWGGKGDPNPGGAFEVTESGELKVVKGYYFYKQVCQAGAAGKQVCQTWSNDSDIKILAFSRGTSHEAEAFVVINTGDRSKTVPIAVQGNTVDAFSAFRTSEPVSGDENYVPAADLIFKNQQAVYVFPAKSVTTFKAVEQSL